MSTRQTPRTNGTRCTFTVAAVTAAGHSSSSASTTVEKVTSSAISTQRLEKGAIQQPLAVHCGRLLRILDLPAMA